jgi:hypothetical protein
MRQRTALLAFASALGSASTDAFAIDVARDPATLAASLFGLA